MSRTTRYVACSAVLLGQLLLVVQSFAVSQCHAPGDGQGMAIHAHHAEAVDHPSGGHLDRHAAHDLDGSDASCRCVAGMHCGVLAAVPADHHVILTFAGRPLPPSAPGSLDTAFGHDDNLFRPPILRV